MINTSTTSAGPISCNLVNHFEHDHELKQYKEIRNMLMSDPRVKGLKGVMLGNVMCGSASLDSLLLTPFGVFIIEYKSYANVHTVHINGQREFACFDENGNRMKDRDGYDLSVKGGCQSSPFDQARINRRIVREKLINIFGEKEGKAIHIGVVIVFRGNTRISGVDQFSENEREWLTIINTPNFVPFLVIASERRKYGLYDAQRELMVIRMDAKRDLLDTAVIVRPVSEVSAKVEKAEPVANPAVYSVTKRRLLEKAADKYTIGGRVAATVTFAIYLLFQLGMLMPDKCFMWGTGFVGVCLLVLALLVKYCYDDDDFDHWFIRDRAHSHYRKLEFRTIEVKSCDWNFSRTALVTAYVIIFLVILALPYMGIVQLLDKILVRIAGSESGSKLYWYVYEHTESINMFLCFRIFMWSYFLVHYAGYVWAIIMQVNKEGDFVYLDTRNSSRRYLIPVPEILNGAFPHYRGALKLALRSVKYGGVVTVTLIMLSVLKPYLYKLFL